MSDGRPRTAPANCFNRGPTARVASNSCSFEFTCSSSGRFSFGNSAMIFACSYRKNAVSSRGGQTFAHLAEIQIHGHCVTLAFFLQHIDFSLPEKTKLRHDR